MHSETPAGSSVAPTVAAALDAGGPAVACLSCGSSHIHAYCAACGQRSVDVTASTWHVLKEALSDATDLDGRILRTVHAIASPGQLTIDFLRGRRAPYIGPVKLFLFAGAALSTTWMLTRSVDARYYGLSAEGSAATYIDTVVRGLLGASFAVSLTAWALARGRRRLLDEAVFAIHTVATFAIGLALVLWLGTGWKLAWGTAARVPAGVPPLAYLLLLPGGILSLSYIGVAFRRVHGGSWWAAVLCTLLLVAAGFAAATLVIVVHMR
jgi:hypothetical protein